MFYCKKKLTKKATAIKRFKYSLSAGKLRKQTSVAEKQFLNLIKGKKTKKKKEVVLSQI